jgi:hypothetical protein
MAIMGIQQLGTRCASALHAPPTRDGTPPYVAYTQPFNRVW